MNTDALADRYRGLVVASCEWRAIGVADPQVMADEVFASLDPNRENGLRDLFVAIDKVVLASYQRFSDSISVLERLRSGAAIIGPRRSPADDFLRALSNLRRADRELLQLRFWDDLAEDEAAEVLRLSIDEIRERMVRAGTRYLAKLARSHPDLSYADVVDTVRSIKPGVHRRFEA